MSERSEVISAEVHGGSLDKVLGLRDLILMQLVSVLSTTWFAAAGRAGTYHIVYWLAAFSLYTIPLALVVGHLHRRTPLEGGLYQWTSSVLGVRAAFIVGWNLWLFSVVSTGLVGMQVATYGYYAFGDAAIWTTQSTWFRAASLTAMIALLATLSGAGLGASKWMHNASGIALVLTCAALILLPAAHLAFGSLPDHPDTALASGASSHVPDVRLLGKLGFGAFCGFEYVAIMSAECRDSRATVIRSIWIAAVVVAALYILGTFSVLAFVPPDRIDSTSPIAQVLSIGLEPFGAGHHLAVVAIFVLLLCSLGGTSVNFTSATRLPMVAGWDSALPDWFTRLHPQRKTPVNAIVVTAFVALVVGLISLIGVGNEESFQVLLNASLMFYALTHLVLFALPLFRTTSGKRAPAWLKVAAASGLAMTLLFLLTSVVPIIDVVSPTGFAARVIGAFTAGNLMGAALLVAGRARRRSARPQLGAA